MGHSDQCTNRIEEELEKSGDERLGRVKERPFRYMEEQENKKRNIEDERRDRTAAASSSEGGVGSEVHRSSEVAPRDQTMKREAADESKRQTMKKTRAEEELAQIIKRR